MDKIGTLEPGFREVVADLLVRAEKETGVKWVITSGRRTMSEQQKLYDQGRKTQGPVVTKAAPGSSAHNFGLAADLAPMRGDGIWWSAPRQIWDKMGAIAEALGLTWGGHFKSFLDLPHTEAKNWKIAQSKWRAGNIHVA